MPLAAPETNATRPVRSNIESFITVPESARILVVLRRTVSPRYVPGATPRRNLHHRESYHAWISYLTIAILPPYNREYDHTPSHVLEGDRWNSSVAGANNFFRSPHLTCRGLHYFSLLYLTRVVLLVVFL